MTKKKIGILGAGESGVGTASLAAGLGWEVFVSDKGKIAPEYKRELGELSVPWEEGCHTPERLLGCDRIVKSPGIPDKAPMVEELRRAGIPVESEIEFAGGYTQVPVIAVTGSNGKTTTTSLIDHILRKAGARIGLGGNIGYSFARMVGREMRSVEYDWYVLELSSFQLDGIETFRPKIAVLTNITPDHLDRYDYRFENYAASKFRIGMNQSSEDFLILNADDPSTGEFFPAMRKGGGRLFYFSIEKELPEGAFLRGSKMIVRIPGAEWEMPVGKLSLKGPHNLMNSMAAALACLLAGCDGEVVRRGLSDFSPVEHRLEPVRQWRGVEWINDSKATNVDSVYYALRSMTRPTVLILGGTDKGNDYSRIEPLVREKVKAIVCMGVDNSRIVEAFSSTGIPMEQTRSISAAVEACQRYAEKGDTVLLSPACASFDLFRNYEDRGRQFKDCVNKL